MDNTIDDGRLCDEQVLSPWLEGEFSTGDTTFHAFSETCPGTNQAYIRNYWATKKREQRKKERDPLLALRLPKARSTKNICSAMARCWYKQTAGLPMNEQKKIFQQLMNHQTFSELQNSGYNNVKTAVLSGVRNTISQLKVPRSASELFVKRTSLTMILNNAPGASVNQCRIANVLGIHRRNIAAASSRLEMKDEDEVLPLSACERQMPRGSIVTNETKDLVYAFWTSETRVSPNKKDICKKRIGRKSVVKHPVHLLDDSQVIIFFAIRNSVLLCKLGVYSTKDALERFYTVPR